MAALEASVVVANGKASGEQAKDQEGLRAGLVLHIILDGVWDEVLVLEVHLQTATFSLSKSFPLHAAVFICDRHLK